MTSSDALAQPAAPRPSRLPTHRAAGRVVARSLDALTDELVAVRRDLHAHPELAWQEARTTALLAQRLEAAGLAVQLLPQSGLVAEVGPGAGSGRGVPTVGLRADLDALPVEDRTPDPWRSTVDGVAHACGHDVHTTALLGAGLALADLDAQGLLPGRVRLVFQPAEEVMPGGARDLVEAGVAEDVTAFFALHCDPSVDVGQVGLREGPITSAADALTVRLSGRGGHTSRPHLTEDLTYALGKVVTDVPAALSRRMDPRSGASLVWGYVRAGVARNVIPSVGELGGTVRILDEKAWVLAEKVVTALIHEIVAPYGVTATVDYVRGVAPVVNAPEAVSVLADVVADSLGEEGVVPTEQSLGGEDFSWFLQDVPGAMLRLGTRTPGGPTYDLHQGDLRVDDQCVPIGARLLAQAAVAASAPLEKAQITGR